MRFRNRRALVGAAAALTLLLTTAISDTARAQDQSVANGESIYDQGVALDGQFIPYYGGPMGGMMGGYGGGYGGAMGYGRGIMGGRHMVMMSLSCATCHGADGHGLQTPMFTSPDITYANLTDPSGMIEPDGERGPTYTDDEIRRAVVEGIDPEGEPLNWVMPRWQLTDAQMQDLAAYLRTLR